MKKYILIVAFIIWGGNYIEAQGTWLRAKYHEISYSRRLKTELSLVEKIKADTIYVILLHASVHEPDRLYPHILWYHQGDSIIAYSIKTFYKKRYCILDTVSLIFSENSRHLECFDKGGWDLLQVYHHKKLIKFAIIDQECMLESCAESALEKRLQHDIALLRKCIPEWFIMVSPREKRGGKHRNETEN